MRTFEAVEYIEHGDKIAVRLRVSEPDWSGDIDVFKLFTFRPQDDLVIRLDDCVDRQDALTLLISS